MPWTEEKEIRKFCYYNHLADKQTLVEGVVKTLLSINYFDQEMYATHGILTSMEIQRHFCSVIRRRKGLEFQTFTEEYFYPEVLEYVNQLKELARDRNKPKRAEDSQEEGGRDVIFSTSEKYNEITEIINDDNNSNNDVINADSGIQKPDLLQTGIDIRIEKNRIEKNRIDNINLNSTNLSPSEVDPKKSDLSDSDSKPKSKPKKPPHPARADIIRIWEERFKLAFVQDKDTNTSLAHIVKKLEAMLLKQEKVPPEHINTAIVEYWANMLRNWDKLPAQFYQDQISFVAIDKQLDKIIQILRKSISKNFYEKPKPEQSQEWD
jgi:hypothetical protein